MNDEPKCPFPHEKIKAAKATSTVGFSNLITESSEVSVEPLIQTNEKSNPLGKDFDYKKEFESLNLEDIKDFIRAIMTDAGPRHKESVQASGLGTMPYGQKYWWPADWGHYGPLFIRLAWHSAGTYRVSDGRGGAGRGIIRFSPLNSWPDNINLDKAIRILWPVKERYGRRISWADLIILAGNVALEEMGLKTIGFAGGREDAWEPDKTYWGSEISWLANDKRYNSNKDADSLESPLAASNMGLIYVNPEGPDGDASDLVGAAKDIRETFARMAMNDEETVALIAGGHAFGKAHGRGSPADLEPAPNNAPIHQAGLGWENKNGKGNAEDTITSGLDGAWTPTPLQWDNKYLEILFKYEWKLCRRGENQQYAPYDCEEADLIPDAHVPGLLNKPMMMATDLALRFGDPIYNEICQKFLNDFDYFSDVFAKAWFKLTHRDMGPLSRYLGDEVPKEIFVWQDPVDTSEKSEFTESELENLREQIISSLGKTEIQVPYDRNGEQSIRKLDLRDLIFVAWVSASTYRDTDKRGGANGARILLEPAKSWEFVDHERVSLVMGFLEEVRTSSGLNISNADLIVFAGGVGVELAAKNAGIDVRVPFVPGRGDATQENTDLESFSHLEPVHDGFMNWTKSCEGEDLSLEQHAEHLFVERASLLGLTPPEMTVLFTGFRSMSVHHRNSVVSSRSWNRNSGHKLNAEFLENLVLKPWYKWTPALEGRRGELLPVPEGVIPAYFSGTHQHPDHDTVLFAGRADLLFASNSVLRSIAEVYGAFDAKEKMVTDFVRAWYKVMMLDRFDVASLRTLG